MIAIVLSLIVLLFCIFFQDLRYRHIHVVFPVLIFALSWYSLFGKGYGFSTVIVFNAGLFALVFLVLVLYMSVKNKKFQNPFELYFGLGDLLFFLSVTPLFLLRHYIVFIILSMLFSIGCYVAFLKKRKEESIPLAGFSSFLLVLILLGEKFFFLYKMTLL